MSSRSIRSRMFAGMIAGVLAFLFVSIWLLSALLDGFVDAEVAGTLERSREAYWQFASVRDELIADKARSLSQIPHLRAVLGTPDVDEETIAFTARALSEASGEEALLLLNDEGQPILRTGPFADTLFDVEAQAGLDAALGGREWAGLWSGLRDTVFVGASPVVLGGTVLGVLVVGRPLDGVEAAKLSIVTGQDVTLVTGRKLLGHACGGAACAHAGEPLGGSETWSAITSELAQVTWREHEHLTTALPLDDSGTRLILSRTLDETLSTFAATRRNLILIGLALAGIAFLLAHRVAGRLARPITDVARAAESIAAGDLAVRVRSEGNTQEIQQLEEGFNSMAERIGQLLGDLNEQIRAAQQASEAKSLFLATMSHELRTPLNGIIGFAEVLGNTQLETQQLEHLQIMRRSGWDLLHIIDSVLDYAHLGAGDVALDDVPFDPHSVVAGIVADHAASAARKGLELESFVAPSVPDRLRGDGGRLAQILEHLVGNAIKFTDTGTVRVDARAWADKRRTQLRVEVCDSGIGIGPEARDSTLR